MDLEDRIYELNSNIDNEKYQDEAKKLYKSLKVSGNILFFGSIFVIAICLIIFVTYTIRSFVDKEFYILPHVISIIIIFIFGLLLYMGLYRRKLAQAIIIKDKNNG